MMLIVEVEILFVIGFVDCLCVLFLCGFIMGVFKWWMMDIIKVLELELCGLYIGVIGWIDVFVDDWVMGDVCFFVVICMLVFGLFGVDGLCSGEFGIGFGIVYDSIVDEEYVEC